LSIASQLAYGPCARSLAMNPACSKW
jgi:hypothetical protein